MLICSSHSNLVLAFVTFWSYWILGEGGGNRFCYITAKFDSAKDVLCSGFFVVLLPSSQLLQHNHFMPAGVAQGRQQIQKSSLKTEG